jgi:desampylase
MIRVRQQTLDALIAHARADAPREACGLLLGQGDTVLEAHPIPNVADAPTRYFRLDDRAYLQAVYRAQAHSLEVVGFYHSHSNGVATPSQTDIAQSHYPDAAHVIVGLAGEPLIAAWRLRYGGAERIDIEIDETIPTSIVGTTYRSSLPKRSSTLLSQAVIIISAAVAFILLLVIALALLPPAPPLPAP